MPSDRIYYQPSAHWERLPPKEPGRHRWVVVSSFYLSQGAAASAVKGARVNLDHENMLDTHMGCIDCEEPWETAADACAGPTYDPYAS